ncbi:Ferric enterobactin binding periplasmic protein FepB [Xenorhabdus nematophila ATCC 19061]|uniref:Ferric enterobactin binding periplasmic protein FepB n=1 Tax=Xenorhabdus nematophila (strain ATCC 19061 / DSM 3370 / CCUG 14189 / LMG 1036 / NCIMB 9965 / AN6) TaxID=406817 RepID=D3V9X7_XENNA|nr:iron-siderophore ABC transporter substrate-binding protein [Xenorhabdus nematophila]CBJ89365.1 Ferric enterobactin binding periplasmic protein FepB [Xenorhabdus nematophila ATCC 19061]CEE93675.1 Ferric enterobactin binding periplasmic protein FepB [Xenorhabdus nematophila str. Anatoliense]CEE95490.1 Ferric enterobactin binding periplasmic protein FepB [Xenorhabdus nematophila str. Anatoliense]CEK22261.1 Ferric enterobactin binding periplasmic protein FepB [Xenorhabdus nematophila AN6/1]
MDLTRCKMLIAVPLIVLASLLTGCDKPTVKNNLPTNMTGYPKIITTELGTAVINQPPQRIVALGTGTEDILLDLGIIPVGIESHRWGGDAEGYLPWFREEIERRGAKLPAIIEMYPELDVEKIINLKPDLILATQSGITRENYNHLSHFVPVVAYPEKPWQTTPRQQIALAAQALDKAEQGKKLIAELDNLLTQTGSTIPHIARYHFAYIKAGTTGNTLSLYVKNDPRVDTLTHLGLSLLPIAGSLTAPFGNFAVNIGLENAELLNGADILVTWYSNEQERRETESQPLFQSIRAVRQGGYIPLTDQSVVMSMSYGSPLSLRWGLPKFIPLLKQEIAKHEQL